MPLPYQSMSEHEQCRIEAKDTPECTADQGQDDYCVPEDLEDLTYYNRITPVMLALFLLFSSVLILNMLVAIFS